MLIFNIVWNIPPSPENHVLSLNHPKAKPFLERRRPGQPAAQELQPERPNRRPRPRPNRQPGRPLAPGTKKAAAPALRDVFLWGGRPSRRPRTRAVGGGH